MKDVPSGIYFVQRHYSILGIFTFFYEYLFAAPYMDEKDIDEDYNGKIKSPIS